MFTAYSVIAQVLASITALTALRMYEVPSLCWYELGEERVLTYASAIHIRWPVCGIHHDVRIRVDREERRQRGDAGADLTVDQHAAVGGQRVVEEEVETAEVLERERQLVDRVGDRDAVLAGVGVDRVGLAARRIVELRLGGARDDALGGVEPAVDARVGGGESSKERSGGEPAVTWAIGCCPTRTSGLPSPPTAFTETAVTP